MKGFMSLVKQYYNTYTSNQQAVNQDLTSTVTLALRNKVKDILLVSLYGTGANVLLGSYKSPFCSAVDISLFTLLKTVRKMALLLIWKVDTTCFSSNTEGQIECEECPAIHHYHSQTSDSDIPSRRRRRSRREGCEQPTSHC